MLRPDPVKLKVDLHTHTSDDPQDYISFSSEQLIDKASALGFDAVAITNHDVVTFGSGIKKYAEERGILLLPGVELTLSHKHVVVINPDFRDDPGIKTLDDLKLIKSEGGIILAPHPFYPGFKCLHSKLVEYIDSFDALEFSFFYNHVVNRNKKAVELARAHNKPLLGTSDCHNIWQVGSTYTLVEAQKNIPSIIAAIKAGKIELVTTPLSFLTMARVAVNFALGDRLKIHWRV